VPSRANLKRNVTPITLLLEPHSSKSFPARPSPAEHKIATKMARLIATVTAPAQPAAAIRHADPLADLTLLLSRLQRTILHADTVREERLRRSELERAKARAVSV